VRTQWRFWMAALLALGVTAGYSASTALAGTITFNFEELSTGNFPTITSTQGGLTATLQRQDGTDLGIIDLTAFGSPPSFGHRSVSNFVGPSVSPGSTLIINFSQPVNAASLSFGDYDGDDDSPVTLTAFSAPNGLGTALSSSSVSYPINLTLASGESAVRTLSVTGTEIESLTFTSGGPFPGTLFSDNLVVTLAPPPTTVPEPSSFALLSLGGLALAGWRRWKGKRATT
jgi:PEP-CTERM motif